MKKVLRKAALVLLLSLVVPCVFAQNYTTYAESSNLNKQAINKSGTIWLLSLDGSFSWNRATERALQKAFEDKGFSVILTTDRIDISGMDNQSMELLKNELNKTIFRYILTIRPEEIYTYTYGKGISRMEFAGEITDHFSGTNVMLFELSTEADSNDMLSLNASRGPALASMADAVVTEYMRYAR